MLPNDLDLPHASLQSSCFLSCGRSMVPILRALGRGTLERTIACGAHALDAHVAANPP